ncbi:MAG: alginate lyase family protein [Bacteroidota bacterium]
MHHYYKPGVILILIWLGSCKTQPVTESQPTDIPVSGTSQIDFQPQKIMAVADQLLTQPPVPITQFTCERSAGGIHDFYSEGDYWWPNPDDPDGPYIRKDGQSNPDNFTAHRKAMRNLNRWVSALVAAYKVSGEQTYAEHAWKHLHAFFLHPDTRMNPNLLYGQAIKGRVTGRGIGIIDTIHLIELTQSIAWLETHYLDTSDAKALKDWFEAFATWLNTHPYGLDEKDHGNNHSTWWAAQVAAFASLTGRDDLMEVARTQFKKLLAEQMGSDGSFPDELSRTKPYNYSLFNLEGYAVLCHIASSEKDNLWQYAGPNGSLRKAWEFMVPFMKHKENWIKPPDVQHFDELPIQSLGLLFAALAYPDTDFLEVWEALSPERPSEEIIRTYPLWEPVLWVD